MKQILLDGGPYDIRHDYTHRGINPRIVLNYKVMGAYAYVQLNGKKLLKDLKPNEIYAGYWCTKYGFTNVEVSIITP